MRLGVLAVFVWLLAAAPAAAYPGVPIEPPLEYLDPPNHRSLPVTGGGLDVTFSCPSYAAGDPGNYVVRFSNGDERGVDGRLVATGRYFAGEALAQPGLQAATCTSHLRLPPAAYPAALYLGSLAWQVTRTCNGCEYGWEVGPPGWVFLTPNVEGAELTAPTHLYAGYLSRFTFSAAVDLSGAELALQGIGRRLGPRGWTDLARIPYQGENPLLVKLPAGRHKLRLNFYAPGVSQGLPYQEFTIVKPTGPWSTGPRDEGWYSSGPSRVASGPATFEVTGEGRALRRLRGPLQANCGAPLSSATATVIARIRSARVRPDGGVVARALSRAEPRTYVELFGRLHHHRFAGTVTTTSDSCRGKYEFEAVRLRGGKQRQRR